MKVMEITKLTSEISRNQRAELKTRELRNPLSQRIMERKGPSTSQVLVSCIGQPPENIHNDIKL